MTALILVLLFAGEPTSTLPSNLIMDVTDNPGVEVVRNGVRWNEWRSLNVPAECKLTIHKGANPDDFYPQASRDAQDEGPVYLEFSLAESPGAPQEIAVVQTSTYPDLDTAAIRTASETRYTTNCLGQHFRIMVSFKIY